MVLEVLLQANHPANPVEDEDESDEQQTTTVVLEVLLQVYHPSNPVEDEDEYDGQHKTAVAFGTCGAVASLSSSEDEDE